MPDRKLWPGAPGSKVMLPGPIPEREKREHPEVTINGKRYTWLPGHTEGIPDEALEVWDRFLEADA